MTPSLRARATIARLVPRRLTRSNAHALSRELLVERVSITVAASVMGRSESIPRFHLAAGYLLPSVVGARAAT